MGGALPEDVESLLTRLPQFRIESAQDGGEALREIEDRFPADPEAGQERHRHGMGGRCAGDVAEAGPEARLIVRVVVRDEGEHPIDRRPDGIDDDRSGSRRR